jgi:hypothetical protein
MQEDDPYEGESFVPVGGFKLVFQPAKHSDVQAAKHRCPDCHFCQHCSDARCRACRGGLSESEPVSGPGPKFRRVVRLCERINPRTDNGPSSASAESSEQAD